MSLPELKQFLISKGLFLQSTSITTTRIGLVLAEKIQTGNNEKWLYIRLVHNTALVYLHNVMHTPRIPGLATRKMVTRGASIHVATVPIAQLINWIPFIINTVTIDSFRGVTAPRDSVFGNATMAVLPLEPEPFPPF